ncbi:histidine phosphatase family protein [Nocardioides dongxiaopingii]|uniref:histidine phosphatase family protein n=1 Tax=Nocardioides TaxID=1839 RepID=UPI00148561E9|nr:MULTISPECIES: histidine phosphatase family protein [Nocardioides]
MSAPAADPGTDPATNQVGGRTLVLLRHGRTAWNHEGRVQGQLDVSLDDHGRDQAARVGPVVAALAPSLVWCSDLARTRETVAPLAAATGLPVTYDKRLREFYFGEYEGWSHAEFEARDAVAFQALRRGDYDHVPAAEPTAAVRERMVEVLGELLAALGPGQTGVAVSHGAAIRVATVALLGWPDALTHTLRGVDNCGRVELVETSEGTGPGGPALRLQAYNRTV